MLQNVDTLQLVAQVVQEEKVKTETKIEQDNQVEYGDEEEFAKEEPSETRKLYLNSEQIFCDSYLNPDDTYGFWGMFYNKEIGYYVVNNDFIMIDEAEAQDLCEVNGFKENWEKHLKNKKEQKERV